uniref:Ornithine transcarbamylase, mitochondrial n=1 Tax=Pachysolen tannophilus TaxID=4918 RepID=OTC_PACTA|nr:RecName: Full=Ornithine transcarbamylase, mitochondrial; Short=OTCase; AltName: Full=Ornithine carbamoyltransferase, mitochondrial; Flags: Precursor [Pachysolen tannophilus]CAA33458.1 ornithine carbamoyltransferase preprotein [Pachysolen tannophilus]
MINSISNTVLLKSVVSKRFFSSSAKMSSQAKPRHLVSMLELSIKELESLVNRAAYHKQQIRSGLVNTTQPLSGKTVSLIFNKRSTRTRVSSEGAAAYLGGCPMFLGKDDIQLGVNESLHDTTKIISSMTSSIFARVNKHSDIQEMCKYSSVPIINALCDTFHPLQAITDILTIKESFGNTTKGLKLAWIGDVNNVINDLCIAALKSGIDVSIAVPSGLKFEELILSGAKEISAENGTTLKITNDPLEAINGANVIVTDTWISMGQEDERLQKLKQFEGFQITKEMISKGKAAENWKFMHCLPRHPEEVHDEVFYDEERSLVFEEGENRLYAAIAVLEGFVVNKGKLL